MDELLRKSEPREEEGDEFRWLLALAPDDLRRRQLPRRAFQPTRYSLQQQQPAASDYADRVIAGAAAPSRNYKIGENAMMYNM
jgi:hypothetical protein